MKFSIAFFDELITMKSYKIYKESDYIEHSILLEEESIAEASLSYEGVLKLFQDEKSIRLSILPLGSNTPIRSIDGISTVKINRQIIDGKLVTELKFLEQRLDKGVYLCYN